MSKLTRYLLVTAALYGPFSYAADPVVVNQSDRKTMYGTAAVRPTPEAFDLASRGMCYVATDTGTVTEWTGTAWITTATCPGSATTSTNNSAGQYADDADFTDDTSVGVLSQGVAESASPTAVTEGDVGAAAITLNRAWKMSVYTPLGQPAMDDTADAVKVLNYVSENSPSGTNVDVDDAVGNIVATIDVGGTASGRLTCTFKNDGDGAGGSNPTIDEVYIFMNPAGITSLTNVTEYTEADFASPSGHLLSVRTGTVSGEADATPDTTLDENDVLTVALDVAGFDNIVFEMGATADNTTVDYNCSHN